MPQPLTSPPFSQIDGRIHTEVDTRTYRIIAIQKAAYRLADRCTVILGAQNGTTLPITVMLPPNTPDGRATDVVRAFFQEILDQELREHLAEETRPVRALILAQAFSKIDLIRRP